MSAVYAIVTERIVAQLKKGVVPWRRPWRSGFAGAGPMSLSTGKSYRGVNRLLLDPMIAGFTSQWWGTYREIQSRGGFVKKGERATPCVYWTLIDGKDKATGERRKIPFLRYYSVFNLDQTENVSAPEAPEGRVFNGIEGAERLVAGMPSAPVIRENGGSECCYRLSTDSVHMAPKGAFRSDEGWYATLFHELGHATGHPRRLSRDLSGGFGSKKYAREELVAELTSSFLCAEIGIDCAPIVENESAYIASWLRVLGEDDRAVVVAAGAAQRAADWIAGRMVEADVTPVEEPALAAA